jgi:hypothetical protein
VGTHLYYGQEKLGWENLRCSLIVRIAVLTTETPVVHLIRIIEADQFDVCENYIGVGGSRKAKEKSESLHFS